MKIEFLCLALMAALGSAATACGGSDSGGDTTGSETGDAGKSGDDDAGDDVDEPPAVTKAAAQAIVDRACMTCHDGNNDDTKLVLKDIGTSVGKASEVTKGTLIVPGKPDESVLIKAVEGVRQGALDPMPYGTDGLEKEDSEVLRAWVAAGAQ